MKKAISLILIFAIILSFSACSDMPFNGDIEFNDIAMTIPETFVRDSTESNEDFWVFERGMYSEYILIARNDAKKDVAQTLKNYVETMRGIGAESNIVSFLNNDAVLSIYYMDDMLCQEILFPHSDSIYAVALRGGTQEGFSELVDTITLIERSDNVAK